MGPYNTIRYKRAVIEFLKRKRFADRDSLTAFGSIDFHALSRLLFLCSQLLLFLVFESRKSLIFAICEPFARITRLIVLTATVSSIKTKNRWWIFRYNIHHIDKNVNFNITFILIKKMVVSRTKYTRIRTISTFHVNEKIQIPSIVGMKCWDCPQKCLSALWCARGWTLATLPKCTSAKIIS